jgi:hypothetical protein
MLWVFLFYSRVNSWLFLWTENVFVTQCYCWLACTCRHYWLFVFVLELTTSCEWTQKLLIPPFAFFLSFWWTDVQSCEAWRRKERWEMRWNEPSCAGFFALPNSFFTHWSYFLIALHVNAVQCSWIIYSVFRGQTNVLQRTNHSKKIYLYIFFSFFLFLKKFLSFFEKKKLSHCLVVSVTLILAHSSTCSLHLSTTPCDPRFPSRVSWV